MVRRVVTGTYVADATVDPHEMEWFYLLAKHYHYRFPPGPISDAELPGASSTLAAYTDEQRARAYDRYRRIQPHLDDSVPLNHLVERGLPLRTLRRWVARYKAGGLTALARQARAERSE